MLSLFQKGKEMKKDLETVIHRKRMQTAGGAKVDEEVFVVPSLPSSLICSYSHTHLLSHIFITNFFPSQLRLSLQLFSLLCTDRTGRGRRELGHAFHLFLPRHIQVGGVIYVVPTATYIYIYIRIPFTHMMKTYALIVFNCLCHVSLSERNFFMDLVNKLKYIP